MNGNINTAQGCVLKCWFTYIGTQLCRQGRNFFLGSIEFPTQLSDLRMYKSTTSKSTKTKAYIPAPLKAFNAKHTCIRTYNEKNTVATNEGGSQIWALICSCWKMKHSRRLIKHMQVYLGVWRGTRACCRVSYNSYTCNKIRVKMPPCSNKSLHTEN